MIIVISSFFKKHSKIKTGDEKRRLDHPWDDFRVVEKVNEVYNYKYKLGRENVQGENM